MNRIHRIASRGTTFALLAILATGPSQSADVPGGDSPEAVFENMRTAAGDNDYLAMADCISPEGRAEISTMMFLAASMTAAFSQMGGEMAADMAEATGSSAPPPEPEEDLNAKLQALLARHGLDQATLEAAGPGSEGRPKELESPEFFADIMTFLDELPDEGDGSGSEGGFTIPQGDLENLEIDGDRASAQVGDEPMQFVRLDGRWYLDPDLGF